MTAFVVDDAGWYAVIDDKGRHRKVSADKVGRC
jgi:hypothetical protein